MFWAAGRKSFETRHLLQPSRPLHYPTAMKSKVSFAPPASSDSLRQLRAAYPGLPETYLSFLESSNGAEGDLGVTPGWFVVWSAERALSAAIEYQLGEFLPGFFAFGSNGGGELFVFQIASEHQAVFMVPAIGMSADLLVPISSTFELFRSEMGQVLRPGV